MDDGFKHIKVTAAEEDEVVIAGAVPDAAPDEAPGAVPGAAPDEASGTAPGAITDAAPDFASLPTPAPAPQRPQPTPADGGYHETTLEDLEGAKMPLAQRIVIVAAIICIIGALVYYFVAMR